MADIVIVDAATGQRAERDYTAEELVQREADAAAEAARQQAEAEALAAREAALTKLAALGITVDDLTALGL